MQLRYSGEPIWHRTATRVSATTFMSNVCDLINGHRDDL
jgi:hypothetical protein